MNYRDSSVVAIIQARMDSSRLPGKVLMEIGGKPMLGRVVTRARHAQNIGQVVVATTVQPGDDPVAEYCRVHGFPCYRGDAIDVLDRYYQAARLFGARTIVRLTGDCPLIDPAEIDRTYWAFKEAGADFAANRLPPPWTRTTPIGMDTEVVTFDALKRAWQEAETHYAREHVMPFFYEEEGRFRVLLADNEPDLGHLRLTVDTAQDMALIRQIYAYFDYSDDFALADILSLITSRPDLLAINASVAHKTFTEFDQRR